ncbi:MAG: hypothetical protein IIT65_02155 [Lachnospiraceae bacterium]|nr:hypothetical protein [Lachnospiraceae bacterium]
MNKKLFKIIVILIVVVDIGFIASRLFLNNKTNKQPDASEFASDGVTVNTSKGEGLSYTEFYKDDGFKKPVIYLGHGLGNNKSSTYSLAAKLADNDYYVICADAYGHGDTESSEFLSASEIIIETGKNLDIIFSHCESNENADFSKLGIGGFSLGAEVGYYYISYGKYPVSVMCGCCGTPDFEELIGYNIAYSKYKYGKWKDVTDSSGKSAINSILRDNNPISKIDNFIDVDMFFMIGEDDTTLPNDVSKSFIYDHIVGNNSQVKIYKQEHEFTDNNYNDMLDYFIQYLN